MMSPTVYSELERIRDCGRSGAPDDFRGAWVADIDGGEVLRRMLMGEPSLAAQGLAKLTFLMCLVMPAAFVAAVELERGKLRGSGTTAAHPRDMACVPEGTIVDWIDA